MSLSWHRAMTAAILAASITLAGCGGGGTPNGGADLQAPPSASSASPTPSPQGGALTGTWTGDYESDVYDRIEGPFTVEISQSESRVTGTIDVERSPCVSHGDITGAVSGNRIRFGAVEGQSRVAFSGTVSGDEMSGTYTTTCGSDEGHWEASRT